MKKFSLSKITLIILITAGLYSIFNVRTWKRNPIIYSDTFSYYAYLPMYFIKHDMTLKFLDTEPQSYFQQLWYNTSPTGMRYAKMTMGIAVLYAPFFFIGHFLAGLFQFPEDGFSLPYKIMLVLSGFFYAAVGMIYLRKILLRFVSEAATALTLFAMAAGTNLLNYATSESTMSHAFSFCIFSVFLFCTIRWHEKASFKNTLLLGLCAGLAVLVRPSNLLILLIPFLYGVTNRKTFLEKLNLLRSKIIPILVCMAIVSCMFIPQLMYWKLVSGKFFFYSYLEEHFFFSHPHILEGLFGFRKGWFVYTPMMFFSIIGFYFLRKKTPQLFFPLLFFTLINIWVVLSWWCWWYGGGWGLRAFVESYAFLALPMACLFDAALRKIIWGVPVTIIVFGLTYINIFQFMQYKSSQLHWDAMSKPLYWKIFMTRKWPDDYGALQIHPDYENAKKGLPERTAGNN